MTSQVIDRATVLRFVEPVARQAVKSSRSQTGGLFTRPVAFELKQPPFLLL